VERVKKVEKQDRKELDGLLHDLCVAQGVVTRSRGEGKFAEGDVAVRDMAKSYVVDFVDARVQEVKVPPRVCSEEEMIAGISEAFLEFLKLQEYGRYEYRPSVVLKRAIEKVAAEMVAAEMVEKGIGGGK